MVKSLIRLAILTQYQRVTDGLMDVVRGKNRTMKVFVRKIGPNG